MAHPRTNTAAPSASPAPTTSPAGSTPFEQQANTPAANAPAPLVDRISADDHGRLPPDVQALYKAPRFEGAPFELNVTKSQPKPSASPLAGPEAIALKAKLVDGAIDAMGIPEASQQAAADWLFKRAHLVKDASGEHSAAFTGIDGHPVTTIGEALKHWKESDDAFPNDLLAPIDPAIAEAKKTDAERALEDSRPLEPAKPKNITITQSESEDFARYEAANAEAQKSGGQVIVIPDEAKPATRQFEPGVDVPISYADSTDFAKYEAAQRIATAQGGQVVVTGSAKDHTAEELEQASQAGRRGFKQFGNGYGR